MTKTKKYMAVVGIGLAVSVGTSVGAITYVSAFSIAIIIIPLEISVTIFPPLGILLFLSALVCISALMLNSILKLIKIENLFSKIKGFLSDMVNIDSDLPRNKNKSRARIIFERITITS